MNRGAFQLVIVSFHAANWRRRAVAEWPGSGEGSQGAEVFERGGQAGYGSMQAFGVLVDVIEHD